MNAKPEGDTMCVLVVHLFGMSDSGIIHNFIEPEPISIQIPDLTIVMMKVNMID